MAETGSVPELKKIKAVFNCMIVNMISNGSWDENLNRNLFTYSNDGLWWSACIFLYV